MSELGNSGKDTIEQALAAVAGEQRVRLLGPWHVAHDTSDGQNTLAAGGTPIVGMVPAGVLIYDAWAECTEPFNGGTTKLQIIVGTGSKVIGEWYVLEVQTQEGFFWASNDITEPGERRIFRLGEETPITISIDAGSPTTGEADIYVLIAEPVE